MNITCPNCNTSYAVDPMTFPSDGRSVRCARCKTVWHAIAYQPAPTILPPEDDETETEPTTGAATGTALAPIAEKANLPAEPVGAQIVDDGAAGAPPADDFDSAQMASTRAQLAARRAGKRPKVRYKSGGYRSLEAFVLGGIVAIVYGAVHFREDVVRSLPSSAGLYELVGLPVNLLGLDFDRVTQRRDFEDGVPVLIVEGEIVNVRDRPTAVPALRFSLRGKGGDELYAWTLEPRQRVVEPDASMNFRTRLASPPRGAENLQVRFVERDRRVVERAE